MIRRPPRSTRVSPRRQRQMCIRDSCYPLHCLPLFSASLSPALSVYLCMNVGPWGLLVVGLPVWFVPHSASLWVWLQQPESSLPQLPISTPPTSLDECFFFIYLVSDFLAIQFSVSSGCARRQSVSTYASILVLQDWVLILVLLLVLV